MNWKSVWVALLSVGPLVCGCASTEPNLRPAKQPDEFHAPPQEATYSNPIQYPAEYMEQDPLMRKTKNGGVPGLMQRPGAMGQQRPF